MNSALAADARALGLNGDPVTPKPKAKPFSQGQLIAISKALADTECGLTGSEIGQVLAQVRIKDLYPTATKWKRLHDAFVQVQNATQTGTPILNFIYHALEPARYAGRLDVLQGRISAVNVPLALYGLEFREDGKFRKCEAATTLSEAESRASRLRASLLQRNVDPEILRFCRAELLQNNYFHAVLEATKSVAAKLRAVSGLTSDGAELAIAVLGGQDPVLRINDYSTETQRGEQRGFTNLLIGLFGTFRNPTAHAPRNEWPMGEQDALDILSLASYVHRRLRTVSRRSGS